MKALLVSVLSYIFVKMLIKNAEKFNLLDVPNDRSHHDDITPRGGGIGFVFAFFIGIFVFHNDIFIENWYLFLSIFLVFCAGILDDRFEVSAKLKFIVIFVAVCVLWHDGVSIDTLGSWFGHKINLVWWLALPFTIFAVAGFTNALNLIDGLDGLSTSISIIILLFFAFIGYKHSSMLMIVLAISSVSVLIGFLVLNWHPAKIFMGDSGSLTLGFIISVLAILSIRYIHPIIVLYLAAIPLLDTLVVMVRRIRKGKSPFSPDKTHIHHILVRFFDNNVKKTVIFISILQIVFSLIGYSLIDLIKIDKNGDVPFYALLGFGLMFVLFYMIFTGMKRRQKLIDLKENH